MVLASQIFTVPSLSMDFQRISSLLLSSRMTGAATDTSYQGHAVYLQLVLPGMFSPGTGAMVGMISTMAGGIIAPIVIQVFALVTIQVVRSLSGLSISCPIAGDLAIPSMIRSNNDHPVLFELLLPELYRAPDPAHLLVHIFHRLLLLRASPYRWPISSVYSR